MDYKTKTEDPHWREEELQWARILSSGDPVKGMVLVLMQKVCTAFHEFGPAFEADAVDVSKTGFFRDRFANRIRMLVDTMSTNELEDLDGYADMNRLLEQVTAADSVSELAGLTEDVHLLGHKICDALEDALD